MIADERRVASIKVGDLGQTEIGPITNPVTGEEHRAINARVNRDVGAASVAKSTVDQLERANAALEREIARRRR